MFLLRSCSNSSKGERRAYEIGGFVIFIGNVVFVHFLLEASTWAVSNTTEIQARAMASHIEPSDQRGQ